MSPLPGPVRFGVFELDPLSAQIRKHGLRIKLQDQPFLLLVLLLSRPAHLFTREHISRILWPSASTLDSSRALNKAVAKLRHALGDSPTTPLFIETVPRRGYRFIAPVESIPAPARPSTIPRPNPSDPASPATPPASPKRLHRLLATLRRLTTSS